MTKLTLQLQCKKLVLHALNILFLRTKMWHNPNIYWVQQLTGHRLFMFFTLYRLQRISFLTNYSQNDKNWRCNVTKKRYLTTLVIISNIFCNKILWSLSVPLHVMLEVCTLHAYTYFTVCDKKLLFRRYILLLVHYLWLFFLWVLR